VDKRTIYKELEKILLRVKNTDYDQHTKESLSYKLKSVELDMQLLTEKLEDELSGVISVDSSWRMFPSTGIVSVNNNSLEHLEDGYRFATEINEKGYISWRWKYLVENNADHGYYIGVRYFLKDKDGQELDEDKRYKYADPHSKIMIRGKGYIHLSEVKRVAWRSKWKIASSREKLSEYSKSI